MKFSSLASAVALAVSSASAVTVYLAGDSTMATASGVITGWGQYFPYSAKSGITVLNKAIGGRSARSYTREGRFQEIINAVQSGDYVVIEFGHNDGGSLSTDNGRTDCSGNGTETCTTVYDGVTETVLTFPAYLQNAGSAMMAKGAKVIMSSQTPNNPWESGTFSYSDSRFVTYAQLAAQRIGATYIDHGRYVANRFQALGLTTTNSYFPQDHTHTSPKGADVVQAAFVKAVLCACNPLAAVIKNSTASVEGSCVGTEVPCGSSSSTSSSTTTTTTTTTSGGGGGCTAAQWGQCGGSGWTGCTTCVAGTTCTYSNDWYSQCL